MAVIKEEKLEEGKRVSRVATPPEGGWGWMIVAGCFLANLCTRAVTRCVSMFFVEFQLHFNKDYSTTSWIHSLVDSMTMLCAPLGGFLGTRLSIRATIMIGGLLSSTGLVLSSFATSLEYLYATMGIMTGLGFALSYTTSIAMVGMYFEQRKALAYGIALSGSGIGTFILAPVVQLLIENYSWRGALLVMGGFVSHLCVCGAVMRPVQLRGGDKMSEDEKENLEKDSMDTVLDSKDTVEGSEEPSESKLDINHLNYTEGLLIANGALKNCEQGNVALLPNQPDPRLTDTAECILFSNKLNATMSGDNKLSDPQLANGSTIEDTKTEDSGFSEADTADASPKGPCCSMSWEEYSFLLTPNFLIFCASCLFMAYGCSAPVVYLVPYAIFQGIEQKHAAFLMSIFGVCGIVGNITFGWITDTKLLKKYRLVCYMVAVGMEGLCCLVLPLLNTFPLLVMFSVVYGYFDGAYVALIPVVASDVVDPSCLTPALGVVYFLHAIPFLISPPIGGWLVDTTGNYTATFFLCGACFIFSAFILGASMLARRCRRSKSISDTVVSPKHIVAAAQRGII